MAMPGERGFTLIELVVTMAIMTILAAAAVPLFEVSVKRSREIELRMALRNIRRALDQFHGSYCTSGGVAPTCVGGGAASGTPPPTPTPFGTPPPGGAPAARATPGEEFPKIDASQFDPTDSMGYPPTLKILVEGVQAFGGGTEDKDKVKYLRRIPLDPMISGDQIDESDDNYGWGARSYQDAPDATSWDRKNVYDVYTKASGKALDGTKYRDW